MPFSGGLEDNEHLKQQAADIQRRAQKRMATKDAASGGGQPGARQHPWWPFWRRWTVNRRVDADRKS
jgi:hypothetical protein